MSQQHVFDPREHSHRRYNPLTQDWVLVSPHRDMRPWQGQEETIAKLNQRQYDSGCYLCAGNTRISGEVNPYYKNTFVFTNDFSALQERSWSAFPAHHNLFRCQPIRGTSRVMCFSPHHSLTLPQMPISDITAVVRCWAEQVQELSEEYAWVQIFENKGSAMGCSNPHPHGQIWAHNHLPSLAHKTHTSQKRYLEEHRGNLLLDYLAIELDKNERIVEQNNHWVALVPYWACWPFEILLLPKRHTRHLHDTDDHQQRELAAILKRLLSRYDNLFHCSFPYSMGWHGQPFDGKNANFWQLHAHFYPPLLRSATIKKFMVGYEMLAEAQRDITPERAASILRSCSPVHFSETTSEK